MEFAIFMICQVVFSAMALYVQQQVFHYCYLIPIFCPCVWGTPIPYSYRMYYPKTHLQWFLSFWCIAEKQPFAAWVTEAVSEVTGLLDEASDGKSYRDAKEKLDGILEVAAAKEKEVSTLSDLSTQFVIARKVSWWSYCKLAISHRWCACQCD